MTEEASKRLKALYTSAIADILDRDFGLKNQCFGYDIMPLKYEMKVAGPAFTLAGHNALDGEGLCSPKFAPMLQKGTVVVLANDGEDLLTAPWGELISHCCHMAGVDGTVMEGACRDIPFILDLGYPLFCNNRTPCDSMFRWQLDTIQEDIMINGVKIRPGDFILGDADGVVCIPKEIIDEVLEKGEAMKERENRIRADILGGMPLVEVVKKHKQL